MERTSSFTFDPVPTVEPPPKALIWTFLQYYDGAGWSALPDREKLEMRPTRWDDQRLRFLDPVEGTADVFKPVQSGTYDVKCWVKGDCSLGVEGDQRIFIKAPLIKDVAVHELPDRLPAFHKSWKPLVFLLNDSAATFRITENLCLILTKDEQQQVNIRAVDYNGGFCCAHPSTFIAAAYGSFAVPGFDALPQCFSIPRMHTTAGDWGFYVHFFPWGFLFIPKTVEIIKPQTVLGAVGLGKKVETVGLVFHPPNIYLEIKIDAPSKTCRMLEAGRDFFVTAKKEDETDLVVYLVLDGQLAVYNYSFDLRINKPGKPKHNEGLYFKCAPPPKNPQAGPADRKGAPHAGAGAGEPQQGMAHRFILTNTKQVKVLQQEGSPIGSPKEQLVNSQTIAYMDAEICEIALFLSEHVYEDLRIYVGVPPVISVPLPTSLPVDVEVKSPRTFMCSWVCPYLCIHIWVIAFILLTTKQKSPCVASTIATDSDSTLEHGLGPYFSKRTRFLYLRKLLDLICYDKSYTLSLSLLPAFEPSSKSTYRRV